MKLIDKEKVVEEIERIKKEECPTDSYEGRCKMLWFEQFSSFLDTLEVKEVDLEKEIKKIYLKHRQYGGNKNILVILNGLQFNDIAKHFYELGLNARKGE